MKRRLTEEVLEANFEFELIELTEAANRDGTGPVRVLFGDIGTRQLELAQIIGSDRQW